MSSPNDIPVAQRVSNTEKKSSNTNPVARSLKAIPWWGYSVVILALFSPIVVMRYMANATPGDGVVNTAQQTNKANQKAPVDRVAAATTENIQDETNIAGSPDRPDSFTSNPDAQGQEIEADYVELPDNQNNSSIKHFAYVEASPAELTTIARASDGYEIRLRSAAAESFLRMSDDARASGIDLVAVSGFRTQDEQNQLFFNIGQQRNQNPSERATVSAPPGYSEHHTGYAVDIGDGAVPSTHISQKFEQTAAFQWLQENGARYGFEMSFPINNKQGVAYEPWHWRFVGDRHSLETFYKTKDRLNTPAETAGAG
ncbi:peptidase M15B and M15C DD-carboxypeptidase VanY/endolysin [Thalassoporum mexicanum PCC 7367]|uniref:M15 family metallopeptidase n=1 Tax=Thalassoporum mexicanum TaxID=3457544 RepID=UPI00029FEC67|nr:M15 family metallopeptidase [Pseudanabaena sp. PCC 7367]AFY68712.1 peptidase M15B and M15C DD-carboxypeptidase VanY/endolysin [Pseudanabaena sp. PCC 7367]